MRRTDLLLTVCTVSVLVCALACGVRRSPSSRTDPTVTPPPTEHRLDRDAEERNRRERLAWFEEMHRTAPDVDWREIERANGRAEQARRNLLGRSGAGPVAGSGWSEIGSSNRIRFREGCEVTITEGAMGSFNLTMEGHNRLAKVKRIR